MAQWSDSMDLVPRSKSISAPTETRGYRDQNAALARDLAPIAQITGQAVAPKTLRGDFLGLEIDRTHLVAVCRFLRDQLGFDMLSCISGVDMLDHLETVYHVRSTTRGQLLQMKMLLDHDFEGHPLLKSFHHVPITVKDLATTQIDPNLAVSGKFQQRGVEHVVQKKLGQGMEERLHPGTPTFGHSFEGHEVEETVPENFYAGGKNILGHDVKEDKK